MRAPDATRRVAKNELEEFSQFSRGEKKKEHW
jgi:hypothetical protein